MFDNMFTSKEKFIFLLKNKPLNLIRILFDAISIKSHNIVSIAEFLKKNNNLLITTTVIDKPKNINRFFINYVFSDYSLAHHFYINANINLIAPSIVNQFSSAIWVEREIFDLFGIFFSDKKTDTSTEDLRRILTDYHFKGHPLRKDFTLIGYSEKIYSQHTKTIKDKSHLFF